MPFLLTMDLEVAYDLGDLEQQARILECLRRDMRGIPCTIFCTGDAAVRFAPELRALASSDHEIACHGLTHEPDEDFRVLERDAVRTILLAASERIASASGHRPRCFRGPRMTTSEVTQAVLIDLGYIGDFSIRPRLFDIVKCKRGSLASLIAPASPYHPASNSPFRRGGQPLLVVPLSSCVLPFVSGVPYLFGEEVARLLCASLLARARRTPGQPLRYLFHSDEVHGNESRNVRSAALPSALYEPDADKRYDMHRRLLDRVLTAHDVVRWPRPPSSTAFIRSCFMSATLYKALNHALARGLRTPPYIILFLSNGCWMKCRHCWFSEDWKETWLQHETLGFDELQKLARSIPRITFLSLTGGEAFARRDVVEIAAMFARETRLHRYQIPTSGYKPDLIVERAEQMLRVNPGIAFRVDVSLDGTREVHEHIRRIPGGFERALTTIRELNHLKQRYAHFDVGVITTISSFNQHEVAEIASVVQAVNPDGEWMVNIVRGEVRDPVAHDVDTGAYIEAHRLIRERVESGAYNGHSGHSTAKWLSAKNAVRREIITRTLQGTCKGGGCAAGTLGGVIYADGEVKPCEMLNDSLGNLRDFDFDLAALWNAPAADGMRAWIQDTRCNCTQECFLSVSMLIQPQHWPSIVRERIRLGRHAPASKAQRLEV